ncbi:hypothetical protein [Solidesulfovibrio sp.]|uniref:hypothetical protein n=1 Tax=Solidesulfovibrio sp. TaxID=2910990 RepID=UPI00261F2C57|nr:hypothetical protein [Solidesulfovibrio sp.]
MNEATTTPDAGAVQGKFLDAFHNAVARRFRDALQDGAITAFFCNDSVMGGHTDDEPRTTIAEMLGQATGLDFYPVSGAGYTAVLFREYAGLVAQARQRPRLAVVSVNLRAFSDDWLFTPRWEYAATVAYLRLLADAPSPADVPSWAWSGKGDPAGYWARRAQRPADAYGDLFVTMHARRDELLREPAPGLSPEDASRREHFINNYMSRLSPDHPMLRALTDTALRLERAGVTVVFYLTPIDVQGGTRLVGRELAANVAASADLVARTLRDAGATCLDLTALLPEERFVDREYACEHLDLAGRRRVAAALAAAMGPRGEAVSPKAAATGTAGR